jgi:serine/threonine protein kinase
VLTLYKVFARKIIRPTGSFTTNDIENESHIVSSLLEHGRHENIVDILRHGRLNDWYFIDMELCEFDLYEYIAHHHTDTISPAVAAIDTTSTLTVIVNKDCSAIVRIQNMWTIGGHIASGLKFMHTYKVVHRDMKPRNGILRRIIRLLIPLVLYSRRENLWKLSDFGISAEATSKKNYTTKQARGTSSYRAPELLVEPPVFNNKVDIWALGCILHYLACGKPAFQGDIAAFLYSTHHSDLSISTPSQSEFLQHHVSMNILHLLNRDSKERPSASNVCLIFASYRQLLSLSIAQMILDIQSYPSYLEWIKLVKSHPEQKFLYQLADVYEKKGEQSVAIDLRRELIHNEAMAKYNASIEGCPNDLCFWDCLADVYIEMGNYNAAIQTYEEAITEEPMNFWLWHNLCAVHIARNDFDGAITACRQGITRFLDNPLPAMELSNIYAAKEDYGAAIRTYMNLVDDKKEESLWVNLMKYNGRMVPPGFKGKESVTELRKR